MDFPTFILTLLSGDWLFFQEGEIAWDGQHHSLTGIQVNGAKVGQFMDWVNSNIDDFDSIQEVVQYFMGFLNELEKDEGLRVPRAHIAPGVRKTIREGDLTGITLANLAACGSAIAARMVGDDQYALFYDTRLALGIPHFFDLAARMLWDLRQPSMSEHGKPFVVAFMSTRNIDADEYLGDVTRPVTGSQENPGVIAVSSAPAVGGRSARASATAE